MVTPKSLQLRGHLSDILRNLHCIPLGVVDTMFLEHLSDDGDGRVDRVGDDEDERFGGGCCDSGGKVFHDSSVDLK